MEAILLYQRDVDLISSNHIARLAGLKNKAKNATKDDDNEIEFTEEDFAIIDAAVDQFTALQGMMRTMPAVQEKKSAKQPVADEPINITTFEVEEIPGLCFMCTESSFIDILTTFLLTSLTCLFLFCADKDKYPSTSDIVQGIISDLSSLPIDNDDTPLENFVVDDLLNLQPDLKPSPLPLDNTLAVDLLSFFTSLSSQENEGGPVKFVSDYMLKNHKQLKVLPHKQQEVIDYCFFVDEKRPER